MLAAQLTSSLTVVSSVWHHRCSRPMRLCEDVAIQDHLPALSSWRYSDLSLPWRDVTRRDGQWGPGTVCDCDAMWEPSPGANLKCVCSASSSGMRWFNGQCVPWIGGCHSRGRVWGKLCLSTRMLCTLYHTVDFCHVVIKRSLLGTTHEPNIQSRLVF